MDPQVERHEVGKSRGGMWTFEEFSWSKCKVTHWNGRTSMFIYQGYGIVCTINATRIAGTPQSPMSVVRHHAHKNGPRNQPIGPTIKIMSAKSHNFNHIYSGSLCHAAPAYNDCCDSQFPSRSQTQYLPC